jgi:hypothetical protein
MHCWAILYVCSAPAVRAMALLLFKVENNNFFSLLVKSIVNYDIWRNSATETLSCRGEESGKHI